MYISRSIAVFTQFHCSHAIQPVIHLVLRRSQYCACIFKYWLIHSLGLNCKPIPSTSDFNDTIIAVQNLSSWQTRKGHGFSLSTGTSHRLPSSLEMSSRTGPHQKGHSSASQPFQSHLKTPPTAPRGLNHSARHPHPRLQ